MLRLVRRGVLASEGWYYVVFPSPSQMCVGARMSVGRQVRMRCFLAAILGVQITIKPERKGGFCYCLCVF